MEDRTVPNDEDKGFDISGYDIVARARLTENGGEVVVLNNYSSHYIIAYHLDYGHGEPMPWRQYGVVQYAGDNIQRSAAASYLAALMQMCDVARTN